MFTITGRISEASGGGPAPEVPTTDNGGFAFSSSSMVVSIDINIRDATGRTIFGALLTKHLETGSNVSVDGFSSQSAKSGQSLYTELQHEVAFAVARSVAFHLVPLRVSSGGGRRIQLNYGAPLLKLGTLLQAASPDGSVIRYTVTSAASGTANAEIDGDGDDAGIRPGSLITVIEADDPAANGRRFQRVGLPN